MAEFLVTFRETLEAALIVGILFTFLLKSNRMDLAPRLWSGVLVAVAASIVVALLFQQLAGGFSGRWEKIFEGSVMLLAAAVLSTMIVWMARNKNISRDLERRAASVLSTAGRAGLGLFLLAFVAVFREGIETVLFLYGVISNQGGLSFAASLGGGAAAIAIGYAIFVQGRRLPLKTFFNVSSVLLILFAAGLIAHGIHEFHEAQILPFGDPIWNVNPALRVDGTYPLLHENGALGGLAKGLFGWNGNPSLPEVLAWMIALSGIGLLWRRAAVV